MMAIIFLYEENYFSLIFVARKQIIIEDYYVVVHRPRIMENELMF